MAASDVKPAIVYEITGFDRSQVVEQLEGIVNHVGYRNKNFFYYLGISKVDQTNQFRKFFKLEPDPEEDQPGNGIISVFKGHQFKSRSYDKQLVDKLDEKYETNTSSFAEDLEDLFKNNTNIAGYPFVTSEVYILLLFEIARQRVKGSDEMKKYNKLKIDEAITNLIALMKADYCRFDDLFLEGGKFHCFSGEPKDRETVIEKIEKSLKQAQRKMRT